MLYYLARRCDVYIYARFENVFGVFEFKFCAAAVEQFAEDFFKLLVDDFELLFENVFHSRRQFVYDFFKSLFCLNKVVHLFGKPVVTFLDLDIFVNRAEVYFSESFHRCPYGRNFLLRFRNVFDLHAVFPCFGERQFVLFPDL